MVLKECWNSANLSAFLVRLSPQASAKEALLRWEHPVKARSVGVKISFRGTELRMPAKPVRLAHMVEV